MAVVDAPQSADRRRAVRVGVVTAALAAIPPLHVAFLIRQYADNVPITDQYELIPIFEKIDRGILGFADLWRQHNEHRIFFPRSYQVLLGRLTHWDIRAEVVSSYLVSLVAFAALIVLIRRTGLPRGIEACACVAASVLFFSPVQYENWLWGWQFEWFLCVAAVLWTLVCLSGLPTSAHPTARLAAGIACSVVATFSLGSGLLVWPVGVFLLFGLGATRTSKMAWSLCGVAAIGTYYFDYEAPPTHPSVTTVFEMPVESARFFLAYLGRPAAESLNVATVVGAIVLSGFVVLCLLVRSRRVPEARQWAHWIALAAYVLLAAGATAVGRIGFGMAGALSSRYTAFSLLFWVSNIILLAAVVSSARAPARARAAVRASVVVLALCTLLPAVPSLASGLDGMRERSVYSAYVYQCTREAEPSEQCLYAVYFPSLPVARERLQYLKERGYGGY